MGPITHRGLAIGDGQVLETAPKSATAGEVDGQAVCALRLVVLRVQFIEVIIRDVRVFGSQKALAGADLHEVVIAALEALSDALQKAY